jgi:hypothetical protein
MGSALAIADPAAESGRACVDDDHDEDDENILFLSRMMMCHLRSRC